MSQQPVVKRQEKPTESQQKQYKNKNENTESRKKVINLQTGGTELQYDEKREKLRIGSFDVKVEETSIPKGSRLKISICYNDSIVHQFSEVIRLSEDLKAGESFRLGACELKLSRSKAEEYLNTPDNYMLHVSAEEPETEADVPLIKLSLNRVKIVATKRIPTWVKWLAIFAAAIATIAIIYYVFTTVAAGDTLGFNPMSELSVMANGVLNTIFISSDTVPIFM